MNSEIGKALSLLKKSVTFPNRVIFKSCLKVMKATRLYYNTTIRHIAECNIVLYKWIE